jgi:hypothetical protein
MEKIRLLDEYFYFRNIKYGHSITTEPYFFENVIAFEIKEPDSIDLWIEIVAEPLTDRDISADTKKQIYCVLDSEASTQFGHFTYECLVFLKQLRRLQNKFPNIIFLINNNRRFKSKMLNHYGFKFAEAITDTDNYVAFLPPITAMKNNKYSISYQDLLNDFHHEVHRDNLSFFDKDIKAVYFPRHKQVDNQSDGKRPFNTEELQSFLSRRDDCLVFDSENSNSWTNEIDIIKRSRFVICHDGSSSSVLGFYAFNSVIITLSNSVFLPSMQRFEKVRLIDDKIKKHNERYYITEVNNTFSLDYIAPLLNRKFMAP